MKLSPILGLNTEEYSIYINVESSCVRLYKTQNVANVKVRLFLAMVNF